MMAELKRAAQMKCTTGRQACSCGYKPVKWELRYQPHTKREAPTRTPLHVRCVSPTRTPAAEQAALDATYMLRAIELASTASGKTYPNPAVGCVILDARGEVVGEGYHPKAGLPHAEVFALRAAGDASKGGTAYVTLEPCDHYGRTPPCSRALVAAGVSRVVVGMVDPDKRVNGGGIQTLRDNGIEVVVGVEEQACRALNEDFIQRVMAQSGNLD